MAPIKIPRPKFDLDAKWQKSCRAQYLFDIIASFFELERLLKSEGLSGNDIIFQVNMSLSDEETSLITKALTEISFLLFNRPLRFEFEIIGNTQTKIPPETPSYDSVLLFSGGLDSYIGSVLFKSEGTLPLLIHHSGSYRVKENAECLINGHIETIRAPPSISGGYCQSRGMLYLTIAAIVAHSTGAGKIILCECGTTIYQPRFGEIDDITFTTYPLLVELVMIISNTVLQSSIEVETPFDDMTKAEMLRLIDQNDTSDTYSCITSRFKEPCGHCYGCVTRRVGFIVSGREDGRYFCDIFTGKFSESSEEKRPKTKKPKMLFELWNCVNAALDFLNDYEGLSYRKKERIDRHGKYDLFRRFHLDTLSCIHIIVNSNQYCLPEIFELYDDIIGNLDLQTIIERIEYVQKQ